MSGETCPRCRGRNGYPLPQSIPLGKKMVFVCRDCGHRWVKRNAPEGGFTRWFIYGFGFLIGVFYGIYELFKDKMQVLIVKAKELFEGLVHLLNGIM